MTEVWGDLYNTGLPQLDDVITSTSLTNRGRMQYMQYKLVPIHDYRRDIQSWFRRRFVSGDCSCALIWAADRATNASQCGRRDVVLLLHLQRERLVRERRKLGFVGRHVLV